MSLLARLGRIGLLLLVAGTASAASAATITTLSVSDASTSFFDDTGPMGSIAQSSAGVAASSTTGFTVGYDAVVGADTGGAGGGTFTQDFTGSFTITFEVTEDAGLLWSVAIDVVRAGALSIISDGTGTASVSLDALTVTHSGAGSLVGSLDLAAVGTLDNTAAAGTSPDQPFLQSSSAAVSGTGTGAAQLVTLAFAFTASVTTADVPGGFIQGDEGAVRLGMDGALASFTADDYPGVGARSLAGDGISVSASVPEPGAEMLLALSLIGLGWSERRRRAAVAPRARSARAGRRGLPEARPGR